MKDIELPPLPRRSLCEFDGAVEIDLYTKEQMQAYARAAVDADRAQRVPDDAISGALFDFAGFLTTLDVPVRFGSTEEASPMVELLQGFAKKRGLSLDNADVLHWSTKLASTPAPAQQEPSEAEMVCAEAYQVVGCLLSDLGLFETEAARKILDNLSEARMVHQDVLPWEPAAQHQEPPQQERKPMTDEQDRALCEAFCNAASDEYFKARPQLDSDANRRIFYAGHRNAWLEWQTAHGIKE